MSEMGRHRGRHRAQRARWSRRARVIGAIAGAVISGSVAFAASNWIVGLDAGSSGQAQSATITNLTITATSSPSPSNTLYPGGNGDVVVTISNPNSFPVTVTAVQLPTNATYATGYSDSGLSTPVAGCASATSTVSWNFATGSSGSSHTLTTAVTVAAVGQSNNPLTVTFTNDASMGMSAPAACAGIYFSMPSFTGVSATGGAATPTTSPVTDAWTS